MAFQDLDQPTEASQPEAGEEAGDDRPTERPAGSASGIGERASSAIDGGRRAAKALGSAGATAGKFMGKAFSTVIGTKIKIGLVVINVGVYLLATVFFVIGLTTMSLGNSGTRGTTPAQTVDPSQPTTLSNLQTIQCLEEEATQAGTKDATIGPECAQQIRSAVARMKTDIEAIRKRIPKEGDGLIIHNKLDGLEYQVDLLTQETKISDLQQQKKVVDEYLAEVNTELGKAGVAGGLSALAGKEASIKLAMIHVIRNKQIVQLLGEGGSMLGSARIGIGIGNGSGDSANYLKKSGFTDGDHVTPLGSFKTGYTLRQESGVYSGQFGSYMGKEVIEYTGGVATGRGLLFHSGKADYDQRNPLPVTYGCVRLTSSDMRVLFNIVIAQKKNVPVEIVDQ